MDHSTTNVKKQEMFRKRSRTVFNKADELARKCDVKVYCLLKREDKLYKYTSSDDPSWPPTTEELQGHSYPAPEVWQLAERRTKRLRPDLQVQTRQTTQSREDLSKAREEDGEAEILQSVKESTRTQDFFGNSSLWPQLEDQGYSFNAGQDATGLSIGSVRLAEVQQVSDAHGSAAPAPKPKVITISLPPILQDTPRRSDFSIAF